MVIGISSSFYIFFHIHKHGFHFKGPLRVSKNPCDANHVPELQVARQGEGKGPLSAYALLKTFHRTVTKQTSTHWLDLTCT